MASGNRRTPTPSRVIGAAIDLVTSGDMIEAIATSLARVFTGFAALR